MPDIVFDRLNLEQGLAPRCGVQEAFGYVTSLTIGSQTFATDISVRASMVSFTSNVVAVMSYYKWRGGLTDPMELKAKFSTNNRNTMSNMLNGLPPKINVSFGFVIFSISQTAAAFYQAMAGAAPTRTSPLTGQLVRQGQRKPLTLPSQLASETVKSPQNWEFDLIASPSSPTQMVFYAPAFGTKIAKNWGATRG